MTERRYKLMCCTMCACLMCCCTQTDRDAWFRCRETRTSGTFSHIPVSQVYLSGIPKASRKRRLFLDSEFIQFRNLTF